ncbi:aldehyde dehydrogenase family protein [Tissierella sp.]|uniref:aldehyde dehydrogenase family protein n=1 Tax=Tissierella sp. TaxID=41274 RepID=UPI0028633F7A|nr:aldehyde dehydrogenase family protein [Tissierella sp.]MDR7855609.1 aldehyde dehydrogenase family protein [Tissierella sp.]
MTKTAVDMMVEKAREAQKVFEKFNQEQVDAIVKAMGKVIYDNAELLAKEAVEETRMGVYEDKVAKNKGKSKTIWNSLRDKKSIGIIGEETENGLILVAKPIGVVCAVTPTTNPIVTPMCNAMFALKGGNAIIVAPHPRSKKSSTHAVALMNQEIKKLGAPDNLIQIIEEPSIELTGELMQKADVVLATGGMAMVKSAYSSGKPSFGVGAGNVQVILDRDIDYVEATQKVIAGRIFDNGIICSGEQSIIVPEDKYDEVVKAMKVNGAFYAEDDETVNKFRDAMFKNGMINGDVVGQSVQFIANLAGVEVPKETKVILLKPTGVGKEDLLCKEKMCPAMIILPYNTFEEAVEIAQTNLELEGKGHTTAIHSNNQEHIKYAGLNLTVSRLVVNAPSSTTAGGSFFNGLSPTTTLGCGTWGNNSISENLNYRHLINVSRVAFVRQGVTAPTDEEIWN